MSRIPLASIDQQPEPIRQFMVRRGDVGFCSNCVTDPTIENRGILRSPILPRTCPKRANMRL